MIPTRILMRHRDGLTCYLGPPSITPDDGLPTPAVMIESANLLNTTGAGRNNIRLPPIYSPCGTYVVLVRAEGEPIAIHNAVSGAEISRIAGCTSPQHLYFSPKGTYLVTWSRPSKGKEDGTIESNLKIWSVASSSTEPIASYFHKHFKTEMLQWSQDEQVCCRLVTNEIHLCPGNHSGPLLGKVHHPGATQFKLSPALPITIGVFQAESGSTPARTTLYHHVPGSTDCTVGSSRAMFSATEAVMHWNTTGTSLLVHTLSDVDNSNTSYYGASGIFLLTTPAHGGLSEKISPTKEGPIHDVKWSPNGETFILSAGHMPSQCTMYDSRGKVNFEFGSAHRNTICFSPHGRFVCLAGFGNLAGEIDFYDLDPKKMKKIGRNTSHCAVSFGWSPDSRYFMTATLTPRMNVDNGFKVFKYNGVGPIAHIPAVQAYDVIWQPLQSTLFPNRGKSPTRLDSSGLPPASVAPKASASAGVYRPPGSTGSLSAMLAREKAPVGKVKSNTKEAPITVFTGATSQSARPRVIPGMAPVQIAAEQEKAKKKAKKESQPKVQKEEPKSAPTVQATAKPEAPGALGPVEKEKRAKAINKKLKLIEELKLKPIADLNEDQKVKISSERDLLAELAALAI